MSEVIYAQKIGHTKDPRIDTTIIQLQAIVNYVEKGQPLPPEALKFLAEAGKAVINIAGEGYNTGMLDDEDGTPRLVQWGEQTDEQKIRIQQLIEFIRKTYTEEPTIRLGRYPEESSIGDSRYIAQATLEGRSPLDIEEGRGE